MPDIEVDVLEVASDILEVAVPVSEYSEHPQLVTDGDRADEDPRTCDSKTLNIFIMRNIFRVIVKYFYLVVVEKNRLLEVLQRLRSPP